MKLTRLSRRDFLQSTALATAATALSGSQVLAASGVSWPIGCFNRPWLQTKPPLEYDATLKQIKDAGYKVTGLLTRSATEPFIASDATPEYLAKLKQKLTASGL